MPTAAAFFVTVSCVIHGHHIYKEAWNSSIGVVFVCFTEEENFHDRKAVISTSDDISKQNIASELSLVRKSELFCSEGERRRLFSAGTATTSVRAAFYITDTKS